MTYDERMYCREDGDCGACLSCRRADLWLAIKAHGTASAKSGAEIPVSSWVDEAITALIKECVRYGREGV